MQRLTLEHAKFIGVNYEISEVQYIGTPEQFAEFCKFLYCSMPNIEYLKVNHPHIDDLLPHLMMRLKRLDCSGTKISKLKHATHLKYLDARDTPIHLIDVLHYSPEIEYLKLGSIADGTRVTIDSAAEYKEFQAAYLK